MRRIQRSPSTVQVFEHDVKPDRIITTFVPDIHNKIFCVINIFLLFLCAAAINIEGFRLKNRSKLSRRD